MHTIFRIETKESNINTNQSNRLYYNLCGGFSGKYEALAESHNKNPDYPSAYTDFSYEIVDQHTTRFATINFCQLLHWFGSQLEDFWEDFDIYVYRVDKIIVGDSGKQCVFNINDVVERIKINKTAVRI